ncbi:hypothetical protein RJ55_05507 [Drechmeria coniospora]|nr:hypothetical protein RJ55_05507 [Drechmeria coniospora]
MSSGKAPLGFPEAEAKLPQPGKMSSFERTKAEAEAKRKRDQAETEAVYKEFIKSFDHDEDDDGRLQHHAPRHSYGTPSTGLNTGRRHFAASAMKKSGPGTLGPLPGAYGAKRSFNDFAMGSRETGSSSVNQDSQTAALSVSEAFRNESDDEDEVEKEAGQRAELMAQAKPQLRLTNMPPGCTPAAIKALFPDNLIVDAVKIDPPSAPGHLQSNCTNCVVVFDRDTAGSALDAVVSAMQNRYLGVGRYLSISRHLPSVMLKPAVAPQPFGAILREQADAGHHGSRRGFAPPSSYSKPSGSPNRLDQYHVPVVPPDDINTLRQIHTTVEKLLKHGAEFEYALMQRPDVQRDERWAWLWDSTSTAGVWYRWRLWELATGYKSDPAKEPYVYLFEDCPAWKVPEPLPFEFVTDIDQFVHHADYNSSDEDGIDENQLDTRKPYPFLNPLREAKLIHLLARLPTSTAKLRKGDVARVCAFALENANRGPSEVVDLVVTNIAMPLAFTDENSQHHQAAVETVGRGEVLDVSGGSLVGLYVVHDILGASGSSKMYRHGWKYRALFEKALKDRKVFEFLSMMPEQHGWGRLRAEKWKRCILSVLHLWEGWNVFPKKSQEHFIHVMEKPPLAPPDETPAPSATDGAAKQGLDKDVRMSDEEDVDGEPIVEDDVQARGDDAQGVPATGDDVEGEPIDEDDVEGEPIDDDDVEGEPMEEGDVEGEPMGDDDDALDEPSTTRDGRNDDDSATPGADRRTESGADGAGEGSQGEAQGERGHLSRRRMRAVDMFADSDDDSTDEKR